MGHQQFYWSHLRKSGQRSCCIYSNLHGLILICGLNMCPQGFCQYSRDTGFIKLD
ncbi:hypothetical protein PANDA_008722, partial [Ailuropoda melanoleuca]